MCHLADGLTDGSVSRSASAAVGVASDGLSLVLSLTVVFLERPIKTESLSESRRTLRGKCDIMSIPCGGTERSAVPQHTHKPRSRAPCLFGEPSPCGTMFLFFYFVCVFVFRGQTVF